MSLEKVGGWSFICIVCLNVLFPNPCMNFIFFTPETTALSGAFLKVVSRMKGIFWEVNEDGLFTGFPVVRTILSHGPDRAGFVFL